LKKQEKLNKNNKMQDLNDNQEQAIPKRKAFDKVAPKLTKQEEAVIARANSGMDVNRIAALFGIHKHTVEEILAKA